MWALERGASPRPGGVRFEVWAPRAAEVAVRIGNGAERRTHPLEPAGDGVFAATVAGAVVGDDYVYVLTAGSERRERPDPVSRFQPRGVHGPSRVVDPGAFHWTDAGWHGLETAALVLYEVHVGTATEAGTFVALIRELARLRDLGITALELMPVGEFPAGRNWGYDGVHAYAPQSTYGGPEGFRRLVDAAHGAGLGVVLDVVHNHLGPEGNYLADFGPYFTDRYRTPWGPAVNFDGPESDEVRRWAVDNALYWVTEFHVDGLRLDAVHAIFDFGARHVLAELAEAVHAQAARLGRRVQVIAESDLNDPRLVRPPDRGGYGLDAQWSDDFHHAVHAALTGERDGYYADFGGVEPVAKCLRDRFVYDGRRSAFRRRRHGAPAGDVPAERFVVSLQNHDQVGNRAHGERLAALVPPPAQRLAAALLLLSPYLPLLFMGEEYGETNPFLYFTSHGDAALVAAVRRRRQEEYGAVPDPQAEETFARSRLEPRRSTPLQALYRDLLRLRRDEPALRPGLATWRVGGEPEAGWLALELAAPRAPALLALFNFSAAREVLVRPQALGPWAVVLSTEAASYDGAGEGGAPRAEGDALSAALPATSALVLRQTPS